MPCPLGSLFRLGSTFRLRRHGKNLLMEYEKSFRGQGAAAGTLVCMGGGRTYNIQHTYPGNFSSNASTGVRRFTQGKCRICSGIKVSCSIDP